MTHNWIVLRETDDWQIEYCLNTHRYKISYFEEGHFKDEIVFREYKKPQEEQLDAK